MDTVTEAAFAGLRSALSSLLPVAAEPELEPSLLLLPQRVTPTGVGGLAGVQADPAGDILGRRVQAKARITVRARDTAGLETAIGAATDALLAADRATLAGIGILRLSLGDAGDLVLTGSGSQQVSSRELEIGVLYELLQLPTAPGGVIGELPVEIDLIPGKATPDLLFNTGFDAGSIADFDTFDDPAATTFAPSDWGYDPVREAIVQRSGIHGGSLLPTVDKPGTYLVQQTASGRPQVADFIYQVRLGTDAVDGIGVVFRWLDVDDFYYLLLSVRHGYCLMGRKIGGAFGFMDSPGLAEGIDLQTGEQYELRVTADGERLRAELDGEPVLEARDGALGGRGRVGFMCHGNQQAFFHRMKLIALRQGASRRRPERARATEDSQHG